MVVMHIHDLGPDETASLAELGKLLQRVASRGPFGDFAADVVARRYRDALGNHGDEELRAEQWRDFILALHTFVTLHVSGHRDDILTLRSIVFENGDLLPYHDDSASHARALAV